jgi:hypothetical protein
MGYLALRRFSPGAHCNRDGILFSVPGSLYGMVFSASVGRISPRSKSGAMTRNDLRERRPGRAKQTVATSEYSQSQI